MSWALVHFHAHFLAGEGTKGKFLDLTASDLQGAGLIQYAIDVQSPGSRAIHITVTRIARICHGKLYFAGGQASAFDCQAGFIPDNFNLVAGFGRQRSHHLSVCGGGSGGQGGGRRQRCFSGRRGCFRWGFSGRRFFRGRFFCRWLSRGRFCRGRLRRRGFRRRRLFRGRLNDDFFRRRFFQTARSL